MRYPSIRSVRHTCKSCDGFWAGIGFEPKPRVSGRLRRAPVGSRAKLSVEYFTGMGPVQSANSARHFREVTYAVSYIHNFVPAVIHRDLSFFGIQSSCKTPLEHAYIQ